MSGVVRCVFADPLSKQSGHDYSAVGWYAQTRAYGELLHGVRLGYTFADFPVCGLPVPCTLESLRGCGFCVRIEVCEGGVTGQQAVQRMIAMDTPDGLRDAEAAASGASGWRVYHEREYDEKCEAALFCDANYREKYKAACEPRLLTLAFSAALASVDSRCPYLYLGDIAKQIGRPFSGPRFAALQVLVAARPGPAYCSMQKDELEGELARLGDSDEDRCVKHYICQLLSK